MAHACNPSYSEGRDQEAYDPKPEQIICKTFCRKYLTKRAGGVAQVVGFEELIFCEWVNEIFFSAKF
jgi:hypothetical protein